MLYPVDVANVTIFVSDYCYSTSRKWYFNGMLVTEVFTVLSIYCVLARGYVVVAVF